MDLKDVYSILETRTGVIFGGETDIETMLSVNEKLDLYLSLNNVERKEFSRAIESFIIYSIFNNSPFSYSLFESLYFYGGLNEELKIIDDLKAGIEKMKRNVAEFAKKVWNKITDIYNKVKFALIKIVQAFKDSWNKVKEGAKMEFHESTFYKAFIEKVDIEKIKKEHSDINYEELKKEYEVLTGSIDKKVKEIQSVVNTTVERLNTLFNLANVKDSELEKDPDKVLSYVNIPEKYSYNLLYSFILEAEEEEKNKDTKEIKEKGKGILQKVFNFIFGGLTGFIEGIIKSVGTNLTEKSLNFDLVQKILGVNYKFKHLPVVIGVLLGISAGVITDLILTNKFADIVKGVSTAIETILHSISVAFPPLEILTKIFTFVEGIVVGIPLFGLVIGTVHAAIEVLAHTIIHHNAEKITAVIMSVVALIGGFYLYRKEIFEPLLASK